MCSAGGAAPRDRRARGRGADFGFLVAISLNTLPRSGSALPIGWGERVAAVPAAAIAACRNRVPRRGAAKDPQQHGRIGLRGFWSLAISLNKSPRSGTAFSPERSEGTCPSVARVSRQLWGYPSVGWAGRCRALVPPDPPAGSGRSPRRGGIEPGRGSVGQKKRPHRYDGACLSLGLFLGFCNRYSFLLIMKRQRSTLPGHTSLTPATDTIFRCMSH